MNLTKRLYRHDEVRAAFLFCLKNRRFDETIFWLKELEESLYGKEVRRLLLVSWSMNIGLSRMAWLSEWSEHSGRREGRLRLCWQLLRCSERDSSLWWLLWSGVVPVDLGKYDLVNKWRSVCNSEDFWSKIKHPFTEALMNDMKAYEIFARVIAFCLNSEIKACSWKALSTEEPIDLQKTIQAWDILSIRKGRVYEIPHGCLYGMTWRGSCGDTTEELNNFELFSSPYWKKILNSYTKNNTWISDTMKESFFDTYFPEDIPDEWSSVEKHLSHGRGVHAVGSLSKWWNAWIVEDSNWIPPACKYEIYEWVKMQSSNVEASCIDRLIKMYS